MGGLLNRLRRFTDDDGRPLVLGFHAVGDAHTCTNPLYGRGCSLALVQALLLAERSPTTPATPLPGRPPTRPRASARCEPWFDVFIDGPPGHLKGARAP